MRPAIQPPHQATTNLTARVAGRLNRDTFQAISGPSTSQTQSKSQTSPSFISSVSVPAPPRPVPSITSAQQFVIRPGLSTQSAKSQGKKPETLPRDFGEKSSDEPRYAKKANISDYQWPKLARSDTDSKEAYRISNLSIITNYFNVTNIPPKIYKYSVEPGKFMDRFVKSRGLRRILLDSLLNHPRFPALDSVKTPLFVATDYSNTIVATRKLTIANNE